MNKAFVKEEDDAPLSLLPDMPAGVRNYITPAGYRRLQAEWQQLTEASGQLLVENRDHALREIEQRMHYLRMRLDSAEIVDPSVHAGGEQIFFGATVTYESAGGERHTVTIVGLDELDPAHGRISWLSPVAQTLLKARAGDSVMLDSPAGAEKLHILAVQYPPQEMEPDAGQEV